MADNTDNTIEDIKRLRTMHFKPRRKTSDVSNSNDPTDSREHLPKTCIYARIEHHTSHVGTPILSHTDLACNTSYHFAASRTVYPRLPLYLARDRLHILAHV